MKQKQPEPQSKHCPTCDIIIVPLVKMWNTKICPKCNKILDSDKGIDKVS